VSSCYRVKDNNIQYILYYYDTFCQQKCTS